MTTLWIFLALFIFVAMLLIWLPHFRQKTRINTTPAAIRKQTNLSLFKQRVQILEAELKDHLLDQQEFDALKRELEVGLLQDLKQGDDDTLSQQRPAKGLFWPSIMSVSLLVIAGYLYHSLGAYKALEWMKTTQSQQTGPLSMAQRIDMMQAQAQIQPDNSQLWFSLGHAYMANTQYDAAIAAFDKVIALEGEKAALLGPKATAMYYAADQRLTADVQALIKQALTLNPQDPSTLLLVGMDAFLNGKYQAAIDAWQLILDTSNENIDRTEILNAIANAKQQLQAAETQEPSAATLPANHNSLILDVSVAPAFAAEVNDNDHLFIFARASNEAKTPLAAAKVPASLLPRRILLDNSHALGEAKLKQGETVEVIAILSEHEVLKPQTGDLKGEIAQITVGDTGALVLDVKIP